MGIIFAFVSMVFAGLNDLLFKEFTRRYDGLVGTFLSGVGLTSAIVFGFLMFSTSGHATGTGWHLCRCRYRLYSGQHPFCQQLQGASAGTGATIYRLNLVVVALLGIFLLGEPVTMWKVAGLILGAVAVLILGMAESRRATAKAAMSSVAVLVVACLLRAVMGILYKVATNNDVPYYELLFINGVSWAVGGWIWAKASRERTRFDLTLSAFSLCSGLLVCGITYFMLAATALADASIVIPITQMSFVVTCILGAVRFNEPLPLQRSSRLLQPWGVLCV